MVGIKGLDVSSYQGKIDWKKVYDAGYRYTVLRSCIKKGVDSCFEYNYENAIKNGLKVGVYMYSYAHDNAEAIQEADRLISLLNNRKLTLPVFYDIEEETYQTKLSREALSNLALSFLQRMKEKTNYILGIYTSPYWLNHYLLREKFNGYEMWLVKVDGDDGTYNENRKPNKDRYREYIAWQYSWKGSVPGVGGGAKNIDLDMFYKDYEKTYQEGWMKAADNKRWWYQFKDGSYARNDGKNDGWYQLETSKGKFWFNFDKDGYMLTGKQVIAGKVYLLADSTDEVEGALMHTNTNDKGYQEIWKL